MKRMKTLGIATLAALTLSGAALRQEPKEPVVSTEADCCPCAREAAYTADLHAAAGAREQHPDYLKVAGQTNAVERLAELRLSNEILAGRTHDDRTRRLRQLRRELLVEHSPDAAAVEFVLQTESIPLQRARAVAALARCLTK